jgi:hypothetical protein
MRVLRFVTDTVALKSFTFLLFLTKNLPLPRNQLLMLVIVLDNCFLVCLGFFLQVKCKREE